MSANELRQNDVTLKQGSRLGYGSFGQVFSAVEQPEGRVVAVKKSRVPIKVARTLLQHEAHILCLLRGHPGIPKVYALGRFPHFEYISMELLGKVLDFSDQDLDSRTSSVALVASQMISALEHVHGHGIVHRDIKSYNMLPRLSAPFQIQLIDFGLARTLPEDMGGLDPSDDPTRMVMGTITYASLNSHLGLPLTRRDDLEALAYTLLEFLRTDGLPWDKRYPMTATIAFIRRQMYNDKRSWSGERFANGYDATFGKFLEDVRAMKFEAIPDYQGWVNKFSKLVKSPVDLPGAPPKKDDADVPHPQRSREPPVQAGQLVYVRILPKASIEGFSASRGPICDWQDPTLTDTAWPTTFLPSIVLDVSPSHWEMWKVSLMALTRRKPDTVTKILLRGEGRLPSQEAAVDEVVTVLGEGWPEGDVWCDNMYVQNNFLWTPDQDTLISSHWTVSQDGVKILLGKLGNPDPDHRPLTPRQLSSLRCQDLYVEGKALNPETLLLNPVHERIDWDSCHAWLSDIVPISERWARDAKMEWSTCYEDPPVPDAMGDSYCGNDIEDWINVQDERDQSATLGTEREIRLEAQLGKILAVI